MAKIKDLPKFKRPREKLFEKGADALSDHELLAILLRTGYQGKSAIEVAKRILKTYPLEKLIKITPKELSKIKGVGKSRASTIVAAVQLSNRAFDGEPSLTIQSPEDVFKIVNDLRNKKREYVVCLYLSARNVLIIREIITVGILTENLIHPREVFAPAIENHAAKIIIVHNHPSGDTTPSDDDISVTKDMKQAGELLGIEVVDHLIVTHNKYLSLKQVGYF